MKQGQLILLDALELTNKISSSRENFVVSEVDDYVVRLVVFQTDFHWHHHSKGDEMFYVISGKLFIDLEDRTIEVGPHQMFTVPKMTRHRTRSTERTLLLNFESKENDVMGS